MSPSVPHNNQQIDAQNRKPCQLLVKPRKADRAMSEYDNPSSVNLYKQSMVTLITITLDKLVPNKNQPRKDFSNLGEMISSINNNGLQKLIYVTPVEDGKYEIIDGERRYRSLKKIAEDEQKDLTEIYVNVLCQEGPIDEVVGIVINLIRDSYSPMEIARGLNYLKKTDESLTNKKIGERIGKSETNVSEYLSLLKLPGYIQEKELTHGVVPFHKLKELAVHSELMTDEDKILEYNKLLARYSKDEKEKNEVKNPEEISAKRFFSITKKLDATAKSIAKFNIEKISSPDDRKIFVEKLDAIIAEAQEKKARLERLA